ncbi:MAG: type 2 isopentenyl-diphosphate Delta-isomerase [Anaerolineaceae bacterium]
MTEKTEIFKRKNDHIRINLEEDVQSGITTGLENFRFEHCALPEIDLNEIDLTTHFLGHTLAMPLLISSMTGGTTESELINTHLAQAAQAAHVALGLGSQRAALERASALNSFRLRRFAPDIPIFANIGAVQLNYGISAVECRELVEMSSADALILHLNPLQEALQPEGQTNFSHLLPKINNLCRNLRVPVIVKEVGWGISAKVVQQLINAGVAAIDIAGAGGTSWSQVEMFRNGDETSRRIASHFRSWGIPTALALKSVRQLDSSIPLIASGGLQTGIDMAKCIALGADMCGMAGRLLKAATISTEVVIEIFEELHKELTITMFSCGARNLQTLKNTGLLEVG